MKTPTEGRLPSRPKHTPLRTCVGCRAVRPKRELLRLVKDEGGRIKMDPSGKAAGRGAYLCAESGCWRKGLIGNKLERALRTKVAEDNKAELAEAVL